MIANKRVDAPVDYRALWTQFRSRIEELAHKAATDAMNSDEYVYIHRKQGEYRFGYTLIAEMDRMLDGTRAEYGPLRRLAQGDDT